MESSGASLYGVLDGIGSSTPQHHLLTGQVSPDSPQVSSGFPVTIKTEAMDIHGDRDSLGDLAQASLPGLLPLLPLTSLPKVIPRRRPYLRSVRSTSETCVCEVCQGELGRYDALLQHKLLHFNTTHVCYACDTYFVSLESLLLHITSAHRHTPFRTSCILHNRDILGSYPKGDAFICLVCVQRFSSSKSLLRHHSLHTETPSGAAGGGSVTSSEFSCSICSLDFTGYRALLAHLASTKHKDTKIKMQSIFICIDCRSVFASRDSYAFHMMMRAQNESCDTPSLSPRDQNKPLTNHKQASKHNAPPSLEAIVDSQIDTVVQKSTFSSPYTKTEFSRNEYKQEDIRSSGRLFGLGKLSAESYQQKLHQYQRNEEFLPSSYHLSPLDLSTAEQIPELLSNQQSSLYSADYRQHLLNMSSFRDRRPKLDSQMIRKSEHDEQIDDDDGYGVSTKVLNTYSREIEKEIQRKSEQMENVDIVSGRSMDERTEDETSSHSTASSPLNSDRVKTNKSDQLNETSGLHSSKRSEATYRKRAAKEQVTLYDNGVSSDINDCKEELKELQQRRSKINGNKEDKKSEIQNVQEESEEWKDAQHSEIITYKGKKRKTNDDTQNDEIRSRSAEQFYSSRDIETDSEVQNRRNEMFDLVKRSNSADSRLLLRRQLNTTDNTEIDYNLKGIISSNDTTDEIKRRKTSELKQNYENIPSESGESAGSDVMDESAENRFTSPTSLQQRVEQRERSQRQQLMLLRQSMHWLDNQDSSRAFNYRITDHAPYSHNHDHRHIQTNGCATPNQSDESIENHRQYRHNYDRHPHQSDISVGTRKQKENTTVQYSPDVTGNMDVMAYISANRDRLLMCRYCHIIYTDQILYYLHMGLHNRNRPWQCNLCGVTCNGVQEFSSHVIHY